MEMSQNQSDSRSGVRKFSFVNMEVSGVKHFENESPVKARLVERFYHWSTGYVELRNKIDLRRLKV